MTALSGMKEITVYCRRSEATVLKWVRECDFPAEKIGGVGWESDSEVIDEWRKKRLRDRLHKVA